MLNCRAPYTNELSLSLSLLLETDNRLNTLIQVRILYASCKKTMSCIMSCSYMVLYSVIMYAVYFFLAASRINEKCLKWKYTIA